MENSQHVKGYNAESLGKNRFRFVSSKQKSKKVSADIYRSFKRKYGVTSAADREESVHRPKRLKSGNTNTEPPEKGFDKSCAFADELELANDRNASELFSQLYRELWPLVRSIPELLHHSSIIVNILLSYLLSPKSNPSEKTTNEISDEYGPRQHFVVNYATTDVMHLFTVLAKDLQQEIHPFVFTRIIPRIVNDLLNPPPPTDSTKQDVPLDVLVIETAFRSLSYIFQHDSANLISDVKCAGEETSIEQMRKFYGPTLGHKRDVVRRLSAETFAPLVRKLKTDRARKRHLRRVLRALVKSDSEQERSLKVTKQAQVNAIDGISLLLFETAKGATGRLHSKGHLIIRYFLDFVSEYGCKHPDIITLLGSSFFQRIYNHIREGMQSAFDSTWEEIIKFRSMKNVISDRNDSFKCLICIVQEAVEYGNGVFFVSKEDSSPPSDARLQSMMDVVDDLTSPLRLLASSYDISRSCINFLFTVWNLTFIHGGDDSFFQKRFHDILNFCREKDSKKAYLVLIIEMFLDTNLDTNAKQKGVPVVLSGISDIIEVDREKSRILLFRVVRMLSREAIEKENADVFPQDCYLLSDAFIDKKVRVSLLDLCFDINVQTVTDQRGPAYLSFAALCIPFLCIATEEDRSYKEEKQSLKWILDNVAWILSSQRKLEPDYQQIVPTALLLDAFSTVAGAIRQKCQFSWLRKLVSCCASHTWALVKMYPESLWVTKSAASLCKVLCYHDMRIHDDINTVFEVLLPNLSNENHYQRLHSLQILNSYPQLPYIVNHADLDLSDDLDEESDKNPASTKNVSELNGCCDIIDTLLKIESTKPNVETERAIISMITRAGLISKSGRLPVFYAETLANHLIGIFHLKYSSLWSAASSALRELSKEYLPILCSKISDTLSNLLCPIVAKVEDTTSTCTDPYTHHDLCVAWDVSKGRDRRLFRLEINSDSKNGVVSPFLSTDRESVLVEVLKVVQAVPEITAKHSRRIVPMFVAFLQNQYYLFHDSDPGARELKLDKLFPDDSNWQKDMLSRKMVNQRLLSFLNMFAEVKGSQQLFQRSLLLSIFKTFLSHQDANVARVALRCILNFSSPRFDKYSTILNNLLKQDGLRDALLMIPISPESDVIQSDDRDVVIKLVLKIMFGRLSASSARGKRSKESISTRRKAIVSSLSQLRKKELFPLVYLMLRNYTPKEFDLNWEEVFVDSYMNDFLGILVDKRCSNFIEMPIQWHEGFLNLLSTLLSQLKRSMGSFVPSFLSVLIEILTCTEFRVSEDVLVANHIHTDDEDEAMRFSQRVRSMRSHAIRCTATLMDHFAQSIDLTSFLPSLWKGIASSVESLPLDVTTSNSMPSVLNLLLVLASHPAFHSILKSQPGTIDNVIKCIGPTSHDTALNTALDFILHFCGIDFGSGLEASASENLSKMQIYLILKQYKERFEGVIKSSYEDTSSNLKRITVSTLAKELFVLQVVGDLMLKKEHPESGDFEQELFDTLCSLLIGLMDHPRFREEDYMNVLKTIISLLPKVSEDAANLCFFSLSKLLKYDNWTRLSARVRREVSFTMRSISLKKDADAVFQRVTQVLEDLFAINPKRVEEMDYGRVLPALSELSKPEGEQSWLSLTNIQVDQHKKTSDMKVLSSVSSACFSLLQQDDVVVSRSAFTALRSLVRIVSNLQLEEDSQKKNSWSKFVESYLVPGARMALRSKSEQIRRHSLSIIREISIGFQSNSSPNLHGDMSILACEENSDLDFFANILHVQTHRRCRALQRLRARLNDANNESDITLTAHSISNVLVPLVLQPIYECKKNLQEEFAQECVATVGALSRRLTWKKYHDVLWTALNQLSRHQEQEKLLVGMICAILDSFHFEITTDGQHDTAVSRTLERRVLPKVEALIVTEVRDQAGGKTKTLRPNIVLAVVKLFRKFPREYFDCQLPRLLATVCIALKNKDSNIRESARKTFGSIIIEIGPNYLSHIINTLSVTLNEGFQLHVRMATLHYVLHSLSSFYKPTESLPQERKLPIFDECIPAIMDLILQDMFGTANETKENADAAKKLVKEAMGAKSNDAIEIVSRLLYFNPSKLSSNSSSIHFVVSPLFQKLREEGINTKAISKIKNCLNRVITGISQNPSAKLESTLEFVFASISPILQLMNEVQIQSSELTDEIKQAVVVWEPSLSGAANSAKAAMLQKKAMNADLKGVLDGSSAPKLTGSNRHTQCSSKIDLNNPTTACAIEFGLNLLLVKVKNASNFSSDMVSMLTPFLDILTVCLCQSRENSVSILSVRCIALLLKRGIKPTDEALDPLGIKIVDILSKGEAMIGSNQEMVHTCLVALTILLKIEKTQGGKKTKNDRLHLQKKPALTFSDEKMDIIVSIVKESLMHNDNSNVPLGLIKGLLSTKFVSPDFYDLMETLLNFSVRSHRESFRNQCSNLFLEFLIHYPLTKNRVEQHLRQVMLNIKYEYKEGRLSAIRLVSMLLEQIPLKLLDEEVQLFFLPLILQMVNDEAEECRNSISKCLKRLTARVSANVALCLFEYIGRWHKGTNNSLRRASLQVFGIFAEARSDFKSQYQTKIMECLQITFKELNSNWQHKYFALISLEKIIKEDSKTLTEANDDIWAGVVSSLLDKHAWVKLAASRIVLCQIASLDPIHLQSSEGASLFTKPGILYEIASASCLNLDAEDQSNEFIEINIKLLTWLSRAMNSNPELCYNNERKRQPEKKKGCLNEQMPLKWLLTRLSNISKQKGTQRRQAIFKCFAAIVHTSSDGPSTIIPYLELMLEPLNRALVEAEGTKDATGNAKFSEENDLAREVLGLLEESCGEDYLLTLASVKEKARNKRDLRKDRQKAIITDPITKARDKIQKQVREKHRRKRRIQERRDDRGGQEKRRYL